MWRLTNKMATACRSAQDALERGSIRAGNSDAERLAGFPASVGEHVTACSQCRIFADELMEARTVLQRGSGGPQPGPFFLARVMASIAARESELEKRSQIWAAVPRLASRLTLIASLTLLVAGSWLYQPPTHKSSAVGVNAEQSSEGLAEGGSTTIQDDFLLNSSD
jgi:hypothetical protein